MRKFLSLAVFSACAAIATQAHAQVDVALGISTLLSTKQTSASLVYLPASERGGAYPSFSAQMAFNKHLAFNAEIAARAHQGLYNGYQKYRPVLYDVNAVFTPQLAPRAEADFMVGVGGQTTDFYNDFTTCNAPDGNCRVYVTNTHLLVHAGADLRYYVWKSIFFRPEVHYYHVLNNFEFHSDNIFRAGASIGYTFGR